MMVNSHRGEVALVIDGVPQRLRLTLGALAALEARLGAGSLMALAERYETGAISAADLTALLAAGLHGAGASLTEEDVARAEIEGGAAAALKAGMALLVHAFRPPGSGDV